MILDKVWQNQWHLGKSHASQIIISLPENILISVSLSLTFPRFGT